MRGLESWWRPLTHHLIERCDEVHGNGESRAIAFDVLELSLPAAAVMIEIRVEVAVRQSVGAGHLRVHAGMHVMVTLHLGRRTVRALVVIFDLIRHCTRLQREVQPDSRKQPEGAAAPGSTLFSDSGQVTQVLVSTKDFNIIAENQCRGYWYRPLRVKGRRHFGQNMTCSDSCVAPTPDAQSLFSSQT